MDQGVDRIININNKDEDQVTTMLCVMHNNGSNTSSKTATNLSTTEINISKRRGSAPCTLLLNQIQKIATSAAKAATTASREHSPRGGGSFRNCRRGSLPSDLVSLGHSRSHSRSSRYAIFELCIVMNFCLNCMHALFAPFRLKIIFFAVVVLHQDPLKLMTR